VARNIKYTLYEQKTKDIEARTNAPPVGCIRLFAFGGLWRDHIHG